MKTKKPQISVIMPLYNGEKYVSESIDSVLAQTVGDFELIIVDDASTDSSPDIIHSYAAKDPRIVILHNKANMGAARSRNRALDIACGDFITFTDADDLLLPGRFARQLSFFEKYPQIDLCGSSYTIFGPEAEQRKQIKVPLTHDQIAAYLLFGCPFGMSSVMLRREAFARTNIRFRESMAEDYQLWVDLSDKLHMANIPESLVLYRRWEEQISTRQLDRQTDSARIIQREYLKKTLGILLSDDESHLFTHFNLRVAPMSLKDLNSYRELLIRICKANAQRKTYYPGILRHQVLRRYKLAGLLFYSTWKIKIKKRLLLLKIITS